MKFLGLNLSTLLRSPFQRFNASTLRRSSPAAFLASPLDDLPASPALTSPYQQVVWVYRAVNCIAEQIANIPFVFSSGERGRESLITSGPLHDFYNCPHPHIDRFQYWELRLLWLLLRGECFRIPIYDDHPASSNEYPASAVDANLRRSLNRNLCRVPDDNSAPTQHATRDPQLATLAHPMGEGSRVRADLPSAMCHSPSPVPHQSNNPLIHQSKLKSILILDPSHFHHIIDDHHLAGWRYTGFGPNAPLESQVFLPDEVWFEKLPNPFNFWRGLSPLSVAALAAGADFASAAFMKGILENNADSGLIVRTSDPLSDDQRAQIIAALTNRKRRAGTPDRPLLLWSGAEVIKPSLSSADLQFLENRKFSRAEICAAFGVPEEIVTTTDHNKYDVMHGARLNFIENRIAPLCARLEAAEARTVRAIDPTAVGWFDLDSLPIMQETRRGRLAAAQTGFNLGVPFNELNRVLDLGFRPLPWGNTGFVANKLHALGDLPPAVKSTNPPIQKSNALASAEAELAHYRSLGTEALAFEARIDRLQSLLAAVTQDRVSAPLRPTNPSIQESNNPVPDPPSTPPLQDSTTPTPAQSTNPIPDPPNNESTNPEIQQSRAATAAAIQELLRDLRAVLPPASHESKNPTIHQSNPETAAALIHQAHALLAAMERSNRDSTT